MISRAAEFWHHTGSAARNARNMEFPGDLEQAADKESARMGDFVYVIQGIAIEPGTAWDLVRSKTLDATVRARLAQELTDANKLFLAR
jgi:hypothetical protein